MSNNFSDKIHNNFNYDPKADVFYIGVKQGSEEEFIEIAPGINIEMDNRKQVIGIEILNASKVFKQVYTKSNKAKSKKIPYKL
jgi:uncharacterized protein YuzE